MKQKIQHIEKLRGISILLVLLFHLELPGFQFGYFGVDVFFVISGFLMARLYGDISSAAEIRNYFYRRCSRILPAYYVVILFVVVIAVTLLLPHEISMVVKQSLWSAFLLPNFGFWQDSAYFDYTLFRPLLNLWSLGVELQFYLLFPLLVVVERYSSKLLLLLVFISFLEYGLLSFVDPTSAFFLLPGRIWEFMAGYYASRYALKISVGRERSGGVLLLGLLIILSAAPAFDIQNTFLMSCIVVLLSFYIVSFGFSTGSENNPLSTSLNYLGKYSYSIYLVHFPVIVFWNYTPFEGTNLATGSVWGIAGIVLTTVILSIALHHLVEIRTRNVLSLPRLAYVSLGACLCVMLFAFLAPRLSSTLFSIEELNISNALNDRDFLQCENAMAITSSTLSSCDVNGLAGNGESVERRGRTDKRFLLHGDSHADGIKLALAEVLAQANHSLRITGEYAAVNLRNNNDAVIEEAVAQDIDVIILHSLAQADYGAALEGFISEAETHGIHVAFIAPVPTYEYDVPKKLALDYRQGRTLDRRGTLLVEHQEKNRQLFAVLERLQRNQENFSWYQSTDYLCDEYCYISADNWIPYYFDTNHLTLTGVRLLAPIFALVSEL